MFPSDGKVVFSLIIILFKFSWFTISSCLYSGFFGCALFGCVVYPFSEVGGSFRLDCFCLLILSVSDIVLLSCSLSIFWCISSISTSENQPFFIIVLTWSANRHSCTWKKHSLHSLDDDQVSYVAYQKSTCWSWNPSLLCHILIHHFYHGWYIVAI